MGKGKKFSAALLLSLVFGVSTLTSFSAHAEQPTLTPQQKAAIASASSAYKASVKQALEGASRAVADAKSLLAQELTAAGKDKTLRAMALSNFKKNTAEIWAAYKKSIDESKAIFTVAVTAAKNSTNKS